MGGARWRGGAGAAAAHLLLLWLCAPGMIGRGRRAGGAPPASWPGAPLASGGRAAAAPPSSSSACSSPGLGPPGADESLLAEPTRTSSAFVVLVGWRAAAAGACLAVRHGRPGGVRALLSTTVSTTSTVACYAWLRLSSFFLLARSSSPSSFSCYRHHCSSGWRCLAARCRGQAERGGRAGGRGGGRRGRARSQPLACGSRMIILLAHHDHHCLTQPPAILITRT